MKNLIVKLAGQASNFFDPTQPKGFAKKVLPGQVVEMYPTKRTNSAFKNDHLDKASKSELEDYLKSIEDLKVKVKSNTDPLATKDADQKLAKAQAMKEDAEKSAQVNSEKETKLSEKETEVDLKIEENNKKEVILKKKEEELVKREAALNKTK